MSIQNEEVAAVAAAATTAWKQYERALESIYVDLQTADAELATALALSCQCEAGLRGRLLSALLAVDAALLAATGGYRKVSSSHASWILSGIVEGGRNENTTWTGGPWHLDKRRANSTDALDVADSLNENARTASRTGLVRVLVSA